MAQPMSSFSRQKCCTGLKHGNAPVSLPSSWSSRCPPAPSLKRAASMVRRVQRCSVRPQALAQRTVTMKTRVAVTDTPVVGTPAVGTSAYDPAEAPAADGQKPFVWQDHWYPVSFTCDLDKTKPHRFVMLNQPLVIWWQPEEEAWHVFQDVCPHRLVPLSEGRINQRGELECGYHAWSFNSCGQCTRIPTGGDPAAKRACAIVYPSVVKQGLLFVKPTPLPRGTQLKDVDIDTSDVPIIAELEDPDWVSTDTWRDTPYDATTLLENVIDASHVPFTHHVTVSNRNQIGVFDNVITEKVSPAGFKGVWGMGPRAGAYGPQVTWFRPPCYMQHKFDATETKGLESMTVVYAVPTTPGNCRLINRNLFKFKKSKIPAMIFRIVPKFIQHVRAQTLLEDDQIFLHLGEKEYAKARAAGATHGQAMYNPSPADLFVTQFRIWLERFAGGGPFGTLDSSYLRKLGPVLTLEQHLDRYSQHTQNCATCQAALKKIRTIKTAASIFAKFSAVAALLSLTLAVASVSLPAAPADTLVTATSSLSEVLVQGLVGLVNWLCGSNGVADRLVHAATWAGLALAAVGVEAACSGNEKDFYRGVYPPPRNLAKD